LNESHHYFFYDQYESPMIAYNVWEATKQIPQFFNRMLEFDQFWCPTEWQRQCTIEQGYPEHRVKVVPEAVNGNLFRPLIGKERDNIRKSLCNKYNIPEDHMIFMIFGRWDYRKSIKEIVEVFLSAFNDDDKATLVFVC
jgi:glycosyltransferase involved in cell wall biosynthesis